VSDGIISEADRKQGGAAAWVYLPAGEVSVTPVPGTAQGKLIVDRLFYDGKEVQKLTFTFKDGKAVSMSGSGPGYAGLKAQYDAVDDDSKAALGYVDLGINENLKLPANSKVGAFAPAGTTTVGIGFNVWAGGDNSAFGVAGHLRDATVTVDGKSVVEKGRLTS